MGDSSVMFNIDIYLYIIILGCFFFSHNLHAKKKKMFACDISAGLCCLYDVARCCPTFTYKRAWDV